MSLSLIRAFDDTNVNLLPSNTEYAAGYVDGRFANIAAIRSRFPKLLGLLSITVLGGKTVADCCDIETGDLVPAHGAQWIEDRLKAGQKRPCAYANRSTMPTVIALMRALGIKRSQVRLFVADYTGKPHRPVFMWGLKPCRADACQYTDHADGRSLDESVCANDFFSTLSTRKARIWEAHLCTAREALRHCLDYRAHLRSVGRTKGPAYAASTVHMLALKARIRVLERLLSR